MTGAMTIMRSASRRRGSADQTVLPPATSIIDSSAGATWTIPPVGANLLPNSTFGGAVIGTPGTLPTQTTFTNTGGMVSQVVGFGANAGDGTSYVEIRFHGTATATEGALTLQTAGGVNAAAATAYAASLSVVGTAGNYASLPYVYSSISAWSAGPTFIGTVANSYSVVTSALTAIAVDTGTTPAGTTLLQIDFGFGMTIGVAYDFTIRFAHFQLEAGSVATAWQATPRYPTRNGAAVTVVASVVELAYVSGVMWALTLGGSWYSYTVTGSVVTIGTGPTGTSPITPTSPDQTVVTTVGPAIIDASLSTWTITAGAQVNYNSALVGFTSAVVELAYVSGVVWQKNTSNDWYSFAVSGGVVSIASGPTTTSPLAGGGGSTSGSPFGTTPPAGAIAIPFNTSIQAAINANPAATAFTLAAGTWVNQQFVPKAGNQFWGDPAGTTILDGSNSTTAVYSSDGSQNLVGVLLKYLTIQRYGVATAESTQGAVGGCVGWTFDQCVFQNNLSNGLVGYAKGVPGWIEVYGGKYNSNGHSGIATGADPITNSRMAHTIIRGAEIAFNNTKHDNMDNDVGGMKLTSCDNNQILNCYVHDNFCDGVWFDAAATNTIIDGNTIIDNAYWGVHYETSDGGIIRNNVINGSGLTSTGVGGAVFVSSSSSTQVYNNNILATGRGNGIILQSDARADTHGLANNVVHNNTITFANAPTGSGSQTGMRNFANVSTSGTSINTNFYYGVATDTHWLFGNSVTSFAFATYRTNTGQDAAATMQTGNASVSGVTHNNATGSGWTG